nr:ABC transporter permease [Actinomycetales bacterium]
NSVLATPAQLDSLEHASEYYIRNRTTAGLQKGDWMSSVALVSQPESGVIGASDLEEGRRAASEYEITLSRTLADRLRVAPGDTVELLGIGFDPETFATTTYSTSIFYEVVGITGVTNEDLWGVFDAHLPAASLERVDAFLDEENVWTEAVYVATDDPEALEDELRAAGWVTEFHSADQKAEAVFQQFTGMSNPITTLSVLFSLIALGVAGLVVGNTMQVLVSQRATLIGMLRSVGATRGQVRSAVLLEAAVIGTGGGLAGAALGHILVALALAVVERTEWATWDTNLRLEWPALVVPVLSGILVTIAASFLPARVAASVRPLAAVRRVTSPRNAPSSSTYLLGFMLVVLGLATALVALTVRATLGVSMEGDLSPLIGLAALGVGIFGIGLLTTSPALFPWIGRAVGAVLQRIAPKPLQSPVRLARTNLGANTRRTVATSNALLVGVALVTLLVTGTSTSRASLGAVSAGLQPVDVVVNSSNPAKLTIPADTVAEIAGIEGVEAIAPLWSAGLVLSSANELFSTSLEVLIADPDSLGEVSYSADLLTAADEGAVVLDSSWGMGTETSVNVWIDPNFYSPESQWDTAGPFVDSSVPAEGARVTSLEAVTRAAPLGTAMVTTSTAERVGIDTSAEPTQLWIRTEEGRVNEVARAVAIALPADEEYGLDSFYISSPGEYRMKTDDAISTVVTAAAGLLAISILIALVGVVNTLALSVFERRREIALLRSVGLTRRQLRASLAIEGLIITTVATILGIVVGGALGIGGSLALFAGSAGTRLVIPWDAIAIIVCFALVAGPLASALPARQALRAAPVQALAEE